MYIYMYVYICANVFIDLQNVYNVLIGLQFINLQNLYIIHVIYNLPIHSIYALGTLIHTHMYIYIYTHIYR